MPVKETSDSLSARPITSPTEARVSRRHAARDYLALAVATCGVGYFPVAPGTWGSAVGVGLYVLLRAASGAALGWAAARGWGLSSLEALRTSAELLLVVAVCVAGVWAATRTEKLLGLKDPGAVVIDEVAGQLITFLFVPSDAGPWALAAGFVAFRLFDIWKPYPVRRLEALESGLGIMADDVLAGAYAATLMSLLVSLRLLL